MIEPRLAAHMRIETLKRLTQGAGGFAMVLAKGDPVSGAILIARTIRGSENAVLESMSGLDGGVQWHETWDDVPATITRKGSQAEYIARRRSQDHDIWVIELDVANRAQFDAIIAQAS